MQAANDPQAKKRRVARTPNACLSCRQSKIKCSGGEPCLNCQRRLLNCHYGRLEDGNELATAGVSPATSSREHHAVAQSSHATKRSVSDMQGDRDEMRRIARAHSIWTSPFTLPSKTIINTHNNRRGWIWLAPSSPWSFTVRLSLMITEKLQLGGSPFQMPRFGELEAYSLQYERGSALRGMPDVVGLPSLEEARYLFDTVKLHLGQVYRLLDVDASTTRLQSVYAGSLTAENANADRLWFVQLLVIIAFGKALLAQSRPKLEPAGAKFFQRAMALLPDQGLLWKDSLLAIETLALIGLYLYCIDHRESGHLYVCQAIRIAQLEGLHTQLPEDELGAATVERCRDLWWTLYIMDRHFSTSLGLPVLVPDEDITAGLGMDFATNPQHSTLPLQVRLWQHFSTIVRTVYRTQRTHLGQFLDSTMSIIQTLAGYAQQLEKTVDIDQNSIATMTRGLRHVVLLYHMCVVIATRPLLLSILMELLDLDHEMNAWKDLLAVASPIVAIGLKSANKILHVLSDEDATPEQFLPFDLYCLCAAAIDLLLAEAVFPDMTASNTETSSKAAAIFEEMIQRGDRVAAVRKTEYDFLSIALREFAARAKAQEMPLYTWPPAATGLQLDFDTTEDVEHVPAPSNRIDSAAPTEQSLTDINAPVMNPLPVTMSQIQGIGMPDFFHNIGISSDAFLSIANQLGESSYSFDGFNYHV